MKLLTWISLFLYLSLGTFNVSHAAAQEETMDFQSDVTRLMSVVVSHLYHQRDVFLRELISNAGDAIEKTRLSSLRSGKVLENPLNVTIKADKEQSTLTITDTGIGMTKDELSKNLGTIARSGTSELLDQMDSGSGASGENLIGKFGLGFYSSFLVAEKVRVTSKSDNDDSQWIFESSANAPTFTIRQDPDGNWLGRGTEITLFLKSDAKTFLDINKLRSLITKHSEFSTSAPIYLWTGPEQQENKQDKFDFDDESENESQQEVSEWERLNDRPPLWMRDPKSVDDDEYKEFYKATAKEQEDPLLWTHFRGDAGKTTFQAIAFIPSKLPDSFYSKTYQALKSLRLFVRRVFITSDAGQAFLPQWLNWVKVTIDSDDLPLNVGRDSLQRSRDLIAIKRNIPKKIIDLFAKTARESPELYSHVFSKIGTALKIGAVEDEQRRSKLVKLLRFHSSVNESVSLDDYVSRRKKGQKQIFFVAGIGSTPADLEKSVFTETALARGYEVLYFIDPMDEMVASTLGTYEGLKFHDVAKKGMEFGDEEEIEGQTKEEKEKLDKKYKPLIRWLKEELDDVANEISLSTRLTTSPCAIVADTFAWTGNMEKLMAAQSQNGEEDIMTQFYKTQKRSLEINPHHPLIEGLLDRVMEVEGYEDQTQDLRETVRVLWDTALVKSGFSVSNVNSYFSRVENLLRRSLGVSETAQVEHQNVQPAPEVEQGPPNPQANSDDEKDDQEDDIDLSAFDQDSDEDEDDYSSNHQNQKDQIQWQDWSDIKQNFRKQDPNDNQQEHDEL